MKKDPETDLIYNSNYSIVGAYEWYFTHVIFTKYFVRKYFFYYGHIVIKYNKFGNTVYKKQSSTHNKTSYKKVRQVVWVTLYKTKNLINSCKKKFLLIRMPKTRKYMNYYIKNYIAKHIYCICSCKKYRLYLETLKTTFWLYFLYLYLRSFKEAKFVKNKRYYCNYFGEKAFSLLY